MRKKLGSTAGCQFAAQSISCEPRAALAGHMARHCGSSCSSSQITFEMPLMSSQSGETLIAELPGSCVHALKKTAIT